ncbi:MAG: diol dehydratase small subunit [Burkholderiales bacterium]
MNAGPIRAWTGRPVDELTIDALREGRLTGDDFRISRAQLEGQADAAQAAGHPQLAENLRRAAELTQVPNERVFEIYDRLRPGRSTAAELEALAQDLAGQGLPRVAAFVREAADAYRARGIVRAGR